MRVKIDIDIAAAHRTDDRDGAPRPVESRDHLSTAAPGSTPPSLSDLCSPPRAAPGTAIVLQYACTLHYQTDIRRASGSACEACWISSPSTRVLSTSAAKRPCRGWPEHSPFDLDPGRQRDVRQCTGARLISMRKIPASPRNTRFTRFPGPVVPPCWAWAARVQQVRWGSRMSIWPLQTAQNHRAQGLVEVWHPIIINLTSRLQRMRNAISECHLLQQWAKFRSRCLAPVRRGWPRADHTSAASRRTWLPQPQYVTVVLPVDGSGDLNCPTRPAPGGHLGAPMNLGKVDERCPRGES